MNNELKPCPFCGGQNLKSGGDDKIVGTWCLDCSASGPNHYGSHMWNDRALCPDTLEAAAKAVIALQHGEEVGLDNELECENNGYQIAAQTIRNLKGET